MQTKKTMPVLSPKENLKAQASRATGNDHEPVAASLPALLTRPCPDWFPRAASEIGFHSLQERHRFIAFRSELR
jgi:hypothetical protein